MSAGSPLVRRRARATALVATVGISAALGLAAPGLVGSPAQAAPNPVDCPTATPIASLARDQQVTALSVSQGTTPDVYDGTVLGVLKDGIGPGRDMIMIDFSSADPSNPISKAGGIWQGMSGSPVYAEDGTLIGAIAYGLAWGSTPIAGVTPYQYMDDYLGAAAPAPKIQVGAKAAQRIAATGEVTASQASQGFEQLGVPTSISGVAAGRIDEGADRSYLVKSSTRAGTSAGAGAAGADTLVAGGSLAAVMSTGDVTYAGVGTVTAVCDGRIVGFGHPMQAIGDASYGLGAADVVMVQEDPLGVPFKASNIGDVAGTIDSDRLSGIAGNLGAAPASTPVVSHLTYGSKTRTGESDVYLPDALASVAFYEQLGNHDSVLDHYGVGSEAQSWVIEGTDENGDPFTINYDERYQSSYDIAVEGSYPLADTLYALTNAGATVTSVTSTANVSDDDSVYRVKRIEQKVDGAWVNVTRDVAKVAPGDDLKLRALVLTGDTTQYVPYTVTIPQRAVGGRGYVEMFGGGSDYLDVYGLDTTAEVIEALQNDPGNDTVGAKTKISGDHGKFTDRFESAPFDLVVDGRKYVEVKVKGGSGNGGTNPCGRVSARGCRS